MIETSRLESSLWHRARSFCTAPGEPAPASLRLGILCEAEGLPQWLTHVIRSLALLPEVHLEAIFLLPPGRPGQNGLARWSPGKWLARYGKGDPFRLSPPALPPVPLRDLSDTHAIAERRLDVLLCAATVRLEGDCSGLARLGVWTLCFGEPEFSRYWPPYWREVFEDRSVSRLLLFQHSERFERGRILDEFATGTVPSLRFSDNQTVPLEAAAGILGRNLCRALDSTAPDSEQKVLRDGTAPRWPTVLELTSFAGRKLARSAYLRNRARGRSRRWFLGIREAPGHWKVSRPAEGSRFREILGPAGHDYADPFLVERKNEHWLFLEDCPQDTGRGCLVCAAVRPDGTLGAPAVILDKPYHLSYPHVFSHRGDYFMIPETCGDRTVQLYRAAKFPFEWKLESVLIEEASLVDTNVLLVDGTWYLFTTTTAQPQETYLFTAGRLDGRWQYHPANPVSSDIRHLRGAGAAFSWRGGALVRPVQDCSRGYGYAITFNEIRRLTSREYEERQSGVLLPTWAPDLLGTHTFGCDSKYQVVDGCRLMPQTA